MLFNRIVVVKHQAEKLGIKKLINLHRSIMLKKNFKTNF